MTTLQSPCLDSEAERSLKAYCLAVEMTGHTWHVPFDTLPHDTVFTLNFLQELQRASVFEHAYFSARVVPQQTDFPAL